jgi:hypothetical protein
MEIETSVRRSEHGALSIETRKSIVILMICGLSSATFQQAKLQSIRHAANIKFPDTNQMANAICLQVRAALQLLR